MPASEYPNKEPQKTPSELKRLRKAQQRRNELDRVKKFEFPDAPSPERDALQNGGTGRHGQRAAKHSGGRRGDPDWKG